MANSLSVSIVFADDPIEAVIDTLLQCKAKTFSGHLVTRNADQHPSIPAIKAVREDGMGHAAAAAASQEPQRLGIIQRGILRRNFIRSRMAKGVGRFVAAEEFSTASNEELLESISAAANEKGLITPSAFGDGKLLEAFLAFITEHWDDILRILLMLLGLPPI